MEARAVPLKIPSGVHLTDSQEASSGRFTRAENVRFVNGLPEKIGGYTKLDEAMFDGVARGALCWNTVFGDPRYAFGTSQRFYVADDGVTYTDRTPGVTLDLITDGMATTALSPTVTITLAAHGLTTGDKVVLRGLKHDGSGIVGGLDIDGLWTVTVTGVNTFTITHGSNATATESSAGGRVLYVFSTTNPIGTTSGSPTVTITKASHGLVTGQLVEISGASAVGGITVDGVYSVTNYTSGTFEIVHTANASSTTTGGGEVVIEGLLREGRAESGLTGGGSAYGGGGYGSAFYGSLAIGELDPLYEEPRFWSIDNYGEDLVLCPLGGLIYYYDASRVGRPTPIVDAPASVRYVFVTDERIVHALGIEGNPLKFAWSDQGDLTAWVATAENQASASRFVRQGSRLMAGCSVGNGLSLLWTDTTCYVHQYTGGDLVYDTRIAPAGRGAGLLGPLAFAVGGRQGGVYWMGQDGFRMFDGGCRGIQRADDVERWVYTYLDPAEKVKAAAMYNSTFNEVWFTFPWLADGDCKTYAMVNLIDFAWGFGGLERTCGSSFDRDGQNPVWFGLDGFVWSHESGVDAGDAALPFTLEYAALGDGNDTISVESLDLDFQRDDGPIDVTFTAYDSDPTVTIDTDIVTYNSASDGSALQPRISGRFIKVLVEGAETVGGDMRMGVPKIAIKPRGNRRP